MNSPIKSMGVNAGGVAAGAFAMWAFASQGKLDLYAIWNEINEVYKHLLLLGALVSPVLTIGIAAYRGTVGFKIRSIASDPEAIKKAEQLPSTPEIDKLAEALKK